MCGMEFNFDEIKEKISGIKDKVEITKVEDGVIFKVTDPSAQEDFDPASIENLKNMIPGGAGIDIEAIPVEGGFKLKTNDPDGLYKMFQQMFDPGFLEMMLKQLMEMFTKMGSAFADMAGDLGGALGQDPDQVEDAEDEDGE